MKELVSYITQNPLFGVFISVLFFQIAVIIFNKTKLAILNPLLIASLSIIGFLIIMDIPLENYQKGGNIIKMMISPVETMVIGVSLYKQFELLKKYLIPVIVAITAGCMFVTSFVYVLGTTIKLPVEVVLSSIPKSITTAIGIEISTNMGWVASITVLFIVVTGIMGAVVGPYVIKYGRIKKPISKGLGYGTSSHAIGTTKAIELGEVEGAMSGLSIGLSAIITSIWIPILVKLFGIM